MILVYDMSETAERNNIKFWLRQIEESKEKHTRIMLIGNKLDMISPEHKDEILPISHQDMVQFLKDKI